MGDCSGKAEIIGNSETINVIYMGNDTLPYGKDASANPQPFQFLVYHYPYGSCDPVSSVLYGLREQKNRGNDYFGYHFYVDEQGKIY